MPAASSRRIAFVFVMSSAPYLFCAPLADCHDGARIQSRERRYRFRRGLVWAQLKSVVGQVQPAAQLPTCLDVRVHELEAQALVQTLAGRVRDRDGAIDVDIALDTQDVQK